MYIKEKRIYCGDKYLEVDIIPQIGIKRKGSRKRKKKVSKPKQKNLNDKNAKRYFIQLANSNFASKDYHVTLTYNDENVPGTLEAAEKEARNYIRRIKYHMAKENKDMKYILVTEHTTRKGKLRFHHHIIMNGDLSRNAVEDLWSNGDKKLGFVNADRLQFNEFGLEALCRYLSKDPQGKKRWTSSQNLIKPVQRENNFKYTRRKTEKLARSPNDFTEWEKQYPEYRVTMCQPEYNDFLGWSIYLKLIKRERGRYR